MWLLSLLAVVAVLLTLTMFQSRQAMLGFPCAIFWALAGAQSYTLSTTTWDLYFLFAFASILGMVTFTAFGAYGLRERRDTYADQEFEQRDGSQRDNEGDDRTSTTENNAKVVPGGSGSESGGETEHLSPRVQAIRRRAAERRSNKPRRGEFRF